MSNEQIKIVKSDLEHLLDLAEQLDSTDDTEQLLDIIQSMRNICQRDIRILGTIR